MNVGNQGASQTVLNQPLVLRSSRRAWERRCVSAVIGIDAVASLAAGLTAYAVRFGDRSAPGLRWDYVALSAGLPLLWLATMAAARAYEARFLSVGFEEFRRVLMAAVVVIATVATTSWATKAEIARGYVLVALPMATALTLLGRYLVRKWVHRERRRGFYMSDVILVGHGRSAAELVRQMRTDTHHGMRIVGACVPSREGSTELTALGVPVLGSFEDVDFAVQMTSADAVAVLPCPEMDGPALRILSWSLAKSGIDLLVAPALIDVAGPRIAIRPVCGLPLLHVDEPQLAGGRRVAKELFDRLAALILLVVVAPVLVAIALAIRLSSPGPAIFRQARTGWRGREFTMWKFRTMVQNAEELRSSLDQLNQHATGELFKLSADPRITKLGRLLRRTSLDELPQLINILRGEMSMVGPRPLPVTDRPYDGEARRRLFVKPGLTGLWQISGRSDLSWEESIRLDLRYVEQWSLALDALIIWKTIFAVLKHRGAY
ncbi:sugar transferase [Pseudonocardia charpentierae]|uniref:Sugar transferase n=1 Tax=Pseudonocardia charpentierae TaxID=3075545 RepID=A0ABU2NII4_9PSEU|nr:sugar transferase [Pseudonocardia sp. DSM 45834]MDT0353781.1 sugar transferase [Pseudonocardia sp. DSM 45834]